MGNGWTAQPCTKFVCSSRASHGARQGANGGNVGSRLRRCASAAGIGRAGQKVGQQHKKPAPRGRGYARFQRRMTGGCPGVHRDIDDIRGSPAPIPVWRLAV